MLESVICFEYHTDAMISSILNLSETPLTEGMIIVSRGFLSIGVRLFFFSDLITTESRDL
jgi:hypothetical protein